MDVTRNTYKGVGKNMKNGRNTAAHLYNLKAKLKVEALKIWQ